MVAGPAPGAPAGGPGPGRRRRRRPGRLAGFPHRAALAAVEAELDAARSALDPIFVDDRENRRYTLVSDALEMFRGTRQALRDRVGAQHPTNAWMKVYEAATAGALLPPDGAPVLTLYDGASLPSAFVLALSHLAAERGQRLEWSASSLAPTAAEVATGAFGDHYGCGRPTAGGS